MQIIYRSQKGSPLTIQEIDGNFQELETRIKALDEKVGKGSTESLAAVNCKGEGASRSGMAVPSPMRM